MGKDEVFDGILGLRCSNFRVKPMVLRLESSILTIFITNPNSDLITSNYYVQNVGFFRCSSRLIPTEP